MSFYYILQMQQGDFNVFQCFCGHRLKMLDRECFETKKTFLNVSGLDVASVKGHIRNVYCWPLIATKRGQQRIQ